MLVCSHMVMLSSGAIQILALLAFVCFPFSIVAVLGNCKQYQHAPEITRLSQAHALVKALKICLKCHAFFFFFFFSQINFMISNIDGTCSIVQSFEACKSHDCIRTEFTLSVRA